MPIRDWMPDPPTGVGIAVAVMLTVTALNNHYREANRPDYATSQEYGQAEPIASTLSQVPHGIATGDEAPNEQQRAYRDLQAQESMAWWARWITLVTGVGVLLLAATLYETRKAGISAAAILTQTKRQADTAEDSFKRLERPYLFLEIVDQNRLSGPGKRKPALNYKITNYGKLPAIFKSIFLELCPMDEIQFLPDGTPRIRIGSKRWYEVLAPGASTDAKPVEVMHGKLGEVIADDVPLALHGCLVYEGPTSVLYSYHFVLTREGGRFCLSYPPPRAEGRKDET